MYKKNEDILQKRAKESKTRD